MKKLADVEENLDGVFGWMVYSVGGAPGSCNVIFGHP